MSATHAHAKPISETEKEQRKLIIASCLCLFFMVVELVGGYLAGSLAIMSDAGHLASDLAGFVISIVAVSIGRLPGNKGMTYGYARAEVIGALVSIMLIWLLTVILAFFAIKRLINPAPVNGPGMFVLGVIGFGVNLVMIFVLGHEHHGSHDHHGHDHSHGGHSHSHEEHGSHAHSDEDDHSNHSHDHEPHDLEKSACSSESAPLLHGGAAVAVPKPDFLARLFGDNIASVNVRAAYIHVLGDVVQNVGVVIAALLIWWHPTWSRADPIITLLFSAMVIMTTYGLLVDSLNVLMEGTPPGVELGEVARALEAVEGVDEVHDLHVWSLTLKSRALSARLSAAVGDGHGVLKEAERVLHERFGIGHTTIQVTCMEKECCVDQSRSGLCVDVS